MSLAFIRKVKSVVRQRVRSINKSGTFLPIFPAKSWEKSRSRGFLLYTLFSVTGLNIVAADVFRHFHRYVSNVQLQKKKIQENNTHCYKAGIIFPNSARSRW